MKVKKNTKGSLERVALFRFPIFRLVFGSQLFSFYCNHHNKICILFGFPLHKLVINQVNGSNNILSQCLG